MRTQIVVNKYTFIKNQSEADTLDVFIDGDIVDAGTQEWLAYWGVETTTSYKSFRDTVLNSGAKRTNIHINSGGGACADALAMHDLIKEQIANGANWYTYGKGIVASAATYPLLAAGPDRTNISENCFFMIHNVSGSISGTVDECESGVKMMRKFNNCARDLYASYFNKPKETIANWMNAETWWQGSEMKDQGFIKNCGPAEKALTNSIPKDKWLFSNTAILNTINNSISKPPKNKGMKKNSIINAIEEGFKKYFTNSTTLQNAKPDDLKAAIVNAINEQEDDEQIDPATITTAVTNAMNSDGFKTLVANAVSMAVTNLIGTENNAISTAITNATKDLVNKDALETLKTEIATKLGTTNRTTKPAAGPKTTNSTEEAAIEDMEGWNR